MLKKAAEPQHKT